MDKVQIVQQLCKLLERKVNLFDKYEQATDRLLVVEIDDLELVMEQRRLLILEIDKVDNQINEAVDCMGEWGQSAKDAIRLRGNRSAFPVELTQIFDQAQSVFAVANRVRMKEPLVLDRFEDELALLTERIKENNRGVSAQAAKYIAAAAAFTTGGAFAGERSRRI